MRKIFRKMTPGRDTVHGMFGQGRLQRYLGDTLLHPRLWRLTAHTAAGGVAIGLFCGLIPGPLQMLGAAIAALVLRVNLPIALITTLYTNPLTIVPLYVAAFTIGQALAGDGSAVFVAPPDFAISAFGASMRAYGEWIAALGRPLVVGLVTLASLLAASGYILVFGLWRLNLMRYRWRRQRRSANQTRN
jgi:uncharacterized protein (DUF2062 family)